MKPFRFRIKTLMAVVLGAALWIAAGIAMVRASTTQRGREEAVIIVVLAPLGVIAHYYTYDYIERRFIGPLKLFDPVHADCPDCGVPLPTVLVPKSLRQAFLGGSNCPACGCEVDRKGGKVGRRRRRPRP